MAATVCKFISARSLAQLELDTNAFLAANVHYTIIGTPLYEAGLGLWVVTVSTHSNV
jgi:hypothetical protein